MTILDNWKEILAIASPFLTFFAGRKSTKLLEKKQQVDAVDTMQKTYDLFLEHYNKQHTTVVTQYNEVLDNNKNISDRLNKLQEQFVRLQLAYAKEIENSQNWEKLHRELEKQYRNLENKYNELVLQYKDSEKKHTDLEKLYEKLKSDFEKHKKQTK